MCECVCVCMRQSLVSLRIHPVHEEWILFWQSERSYSTGWTPLRTRHQVKHYDCRRIAALARGCCFWIIQHVDCKTAISVPSESLTLELSSQGKAGKKIIFALDNTFHNCNMKSCISSTTSATGLGFLSHFETTLMLARVQNTNQRCHKRAEDQNATHGETRDSQ